MGDSSLASTDNDTTMKRSSLNIPHTTSSIISNGEKGGLPNSNGGPPINPIEHDDRFNYGEYCFFLNKKWLYVFVAIVNHIS